MSATLSELSELPAVELASLSGGGTVGMTGGTTGAVGEGGLENVLQFGGLVAGQFAAGHFPGDQIVDLRFEGIRRWPGAGRLVAGAAGLQRGVDVGQGRRQRVVVA